MIIISKYSVWFRISMNYGDGRVMCNLNLKLVIGIRLIHNFFSEDNTLSNERKWTIKFRHSTSSPMNLFVIQTQPTCASTLLMWYAHTNLCCTCNHNIQQRDYWYLPCFAFFLNDLSHNKQHINSLLQVNR